jgi:hypothetical protein
VKLEGSLGEIKYSRREEKIRFGYAYNPSTGEAEAGL